MVMVLEVAVVAAAVRSRASEFAELPMIWARPGRSDVPGVGVDATNRPFVLDGLCPVRLGLPRPMLRTLAGADDRAALPTTTLINSVRDGLQPRWRVTEVAWLEKTRVKRPVGGRRPDGSDPHACPADSLSDTRQSACSGRR